MSPAQRSARGTAPHRRLPGRATLAIIGFGAITALGGGAAMAFFGTTSVPGGSGAAAATVVNKGNTPTATAAKNTVTVSWPASTLNSGAAVTGYLVKRYDAGSRAQQTILGNCTGVIVATSCTENNVPDGSWIYTVTPVVGTNWTGPESDASTVVLSDGTNPINSLMLIPGSGNAFLSGNTIYYSGSQAGSFKLSNTIIDAGSGPASSATASLAGGSTGWTHLPDASLTSSNGAFISTDFTWTGGTNSMPTELVTGSDRSGNTATTTLNFVNDSSGPSGGSATVTGLAGTGGAYSTSPTLHLSLNKGTDPSGLAASGALLQRATASLTSTGGADGVCGTFGGWTPLATDPAASYTDPVADQACYVYRYVVSDRLGNTTTYTSSPVKVDTTAPAAVSGTFSSMVNSYWNGLDATIYYNPNAATGSFSGTATSTDSASGIAGYTFPNLGTSWTKTVGANGSFTYSWSGTPASPGGQSVTATNNAGLVSAGTMFYPTPDGAAPTGASISYTGGLQRTTSVSISLANGSDALSGLGTRQLQRASAPVSVGGSCGAYGSFSTIATNPGTTYADTVSPWYCYKYRYLVYDNVGNYATATSPNVVTVYAKYYDTVIATPGLQNYWRLAETSGYTMNDAYGSIDGSYGSYSNNHRPNLGVAGGIADDTNTAISFNGTNDYATFDKTLTGDFTIEFWFKSTQGIGTSGNWWEGAGLIDASSNTYGNDWGIDLRSDGRIVAGNSLGNTNYNLVSTTGGFDDGAWHQVVLTRSQSTGLLSLYIDGAANGTYTGTTAALNSPTINFGRVATGNNYFAGSLDDVSMYGSVLDATTVSRHYLAGH